MNLQKNQTNELLSCNFNQDSGCFACGTDTGFKIFNCDPFNETFRRDFDGQGIGHVEMLYRCNILALVGGGRTPRFPPNKVMIWDDHQNRCIGELSFRSDVKSVKLRRDRVVVVLEYKVYVYNFSDLRLLDHIETAQNPSGLCAISPSANNILVCPGLQKGHVRVELYDTKKYTLIPAHESSLCTFALNADGTRLATCSEKGTLVRVFDTTTGQALQELRRGADKAEIYCVAFNPTSEWLAVSSDKGTIHVFALTKDGAAQSKQLQEAQKKDNPKSTFSFMKGLLPKYFSSEWSFSQFRVPDVRNIVAFGADPNTIIVVNADGYFYKAAFDPLVAGAEMEQLVAVCFLKKPGDGAAGGATTAAVQPSGSGSGTPVNNTKQ